jgi:hypothetical protein
VPASLLRPASSIKELMALAILAAAIIHIRNSGRRLDRIDIAILVYVGVVTVYLIIPHVFAAGATTQLSPRLLAWRSDAGYPLLLFAGRHAPISARAKATFVQVLLIMGAIVAFIALYQRIAPHSWANFVLNTARVPNYETNVLNLAPANVATNLAYITATGPLRVSSIFLSPFDLGDYMVLIVAVAAVRIRANLRSPFPFVVLAASIGAIFFTRSRSDGLAAVVILLLITLPSSHTPVEGRFRLIGALLLAAIVVAPALGGTRFLGGQGGSSSSSGHLTEISHGINLIEHYPLGLGLGAQPGTANRFTSLTNTIYGGDITDNSITQVGDELGLQALLPWLVMVTLVLLALRRRARGDPLGATMGFALLGVLIAGQYHHAFLTYPIPWTLWVGAGLALSVAETPDGEESAEVTEPYAAAVGVR